MRKSLLVIPALAVVTTLALAREDREADPVTLRQQANGVAEWLDSGVHTGQFSTGTSLFDQEWVFGTAQMAALGFGQVASVDPGRRDEHLARMEAAIDAMLSDAGRAFDAGKWKEDPLASLDGGRGHAAYLGYTNLALSLHRSLVADSRYGTLNDALSDAIAARVLREKHGVFETYPGERYPVDTAAGVASIVLHDRVTGRDHAAALDHWRAAFHTSQRAGDNGLLYQSTRADGRPSMPERGSGTFLTAWFLSFGDPELGCDLYARGRDTLFSTVGPVVGMREYAPGTVGRADIDSGPIAMGLGVSATGFGLGAARACGDTETAEALTRTAEWFGAADVEGDVLHWRSGTALGGAPVADAIMFAMMSTPGRSVPGR